MKRVLGRMEVGRRVRKETSTSGEIMLSLFNLSTRVRKYVDSLTAKLIFPGKSDVVYHVMLQPVGSR